MSEINLFIIEGPTCIGKTFLIRKIKDKLEANNYKIIDCGGLEVRERQMNPLAAFLRIMLFNNTKIPWFSETLLYLSELFWETEECIKRYINTPNTPDFKKIILFEGFDYSLYAYQVSYLEPLRDYNLNTELFKKNIILLLFFFRDALKALYSKYNVNVRENVLILFTDEKTILNRINKDKIFITKENLRIFLNMFYKNIMEIINIYKTKYNINIFNININNIDNNILELELVNIIDTAINNENR